MPLQGILIVIPLISEQLAKGGQHIAIADQQVPIVMSDLMTEVTKKRAIWLSHVVSATFALDIIGFGERNCDDAVLMPGHDLLSRRVSEKVEYQPMLWVFYASSQRQAPAQERIE